MKKLVGIIVAMSILSFLSQACPRSVPDVASASVRTTQRVVPVPVASTSRMPVTVGIPSSVVTGDEVDVLTTRLTSQPQAQMWCTPGSFRLLECSSSPVFVGNGSDSASDALLNVTYRLLALVPQGACVRLMIAGAVAMDANNTGAMRDGLRQLTTMSVTPPAPRVGTLDPVVLLVDFSDRPAQPVSTPAFFANLLFASTGQRKSMRDYYNDASYGKLDVAGDVFPASGAWLRLPRPFSYYNSYDAAVKGNSRPHFDDFLADVRTLADPVVDFSQHDANGDGVVDGVIIIYAGKCDMPWSKGLWSCCTGISWTVDGLKTARATVQNEYNDKPGDTTIGVFCHEFAHSLGARDLYSYDDFTDVGSWSLMSEDSGSLDPWHRSYLGWTQLTDVTQDGIYTVKPTEGISPDGTIVRIMLKSPDEYLLLESRQQQGWDSLQPGHGLLIWHVDETTSNNDHPWYPGNADDEHLFVALLQADGAFDLEMRTNSGDAGDCWHAGQTLSPNSVPSSLAYDRTGAGVQIDGIQEAADGSVSFAVHLTKNAVIAPGTPVLTATSFSHGVQLRWTAATQGSFPVRGYEILRGATADMVDATVVAALPTTARTYFDSSVALHAAAWYQVIAEDGQAKPMSSIPGTAVGVLPGECGLAELFAGVKRVTDTKYPGNLDLSCGAVPLIMTDGQFRLPGSVLAGAAVAGKGRVLAFGHDGFFTDNLALADNQVFARQALRWLVGSSEHGDIVITTGHGEWRQSLGTAGGELRMSGYKIRRSDGAITAAQLDHAAVLVIGGAWTSFTDAEVSAVQEYVHAGGGLLLLGCGWSWMASAGHPDIRRYPMNAVGASFGIQWNTSYLRTDGDTTEDAPVFTTFYPSALPGGLQLVTAATNGQGLVSPVAQRTRASTGWFVTLTPDPGYRLTMLTDNGVDVTTSVMGGTYSAVTADVDHQLVATFAPDGQVPLLSVQVADSGAEAGSSLVVRSASVPVVLTAEPVRAGVLSATVALDGTVVSQSACLLPDGWSGTISVGEGTHALVASVADESGAVCRKELSLVRDSIGPVLTVDALPSTVYAASITVTGTVSDDGSGFSHLWIAGRVAEVGGDGRFSCKVDLQIGMNTIDVSAFDLAENVTYRRLAIVVPGLEEPATLTLRIGSSDMTVNGSLKMLDSPPVIKNGRTLVPIRAIIETLGGSVSWDSTTRKATVSLGSAFLELWIGKSTATVNGMDTPIDVANTKVVPEIINGRTMLPLRFVTENLGATVSWDQSTQTITITYQP